MVEPLDADTWSKLVDKLNRSDLSSQFLVAKWIQENTKAMKAARRQIDAAEFCRSITLIPTIRKDLWTKNRKLIKQKDSAFQQKALELLTEFDSPYNVLTNKCFAFKCGPKLYPGDFKMPFSSAEDMLNHAKICLNGKFIFRENNPKKTLSKNGECPRHFYGTSRKIVYFKHKKQLRSITMPQWSRLMNARLDKEGKKVDIQGRTLDRAIDTVSSDEYPYLTQTQYEKWLASTSQAERKRQEEEDREQYKLDRLMDAEAIDEDGNVKNQELYDKVMNLTSRSAVISATAEAIREAGKRRTEMRKAAEKAEKKRKRDAEIAARNRKKEAEKAEKKRKRDAEIAARNMKKAAEQAEKKRKRDAEIAARNMKKKAEQAASAEKKRDETRGITKVQTHTS